jgi:S1-C subfamily serine protease
VPQSPAARAGVAVGDRMIAIDDKPIDGIDSLQRLLDASWIDRNCELKVLRRSSVIKMTLRPIELPTPGA